MTLLEVLIWVFSIFMLFFGTFTAMRHRARTDLKLDTPFRLYPVTVLKPLKGIDTGLEENLKTFFEQDYPDYEVIFCVEGANDPALVIVNRLKSQYPKAAVSILIGKDDYGINPKVNNLAKGYERASFDWILISDSNVRVGRDYLKKLMSQVNTNTGILTSVVIGKGGETLAADLESMFLSTYYARGMFLAKAFGRPCVIGKSMLFRKSVCNRFGGLKVLARYLAEDFMAGEGMRRLGKEVEIHAEPIEQHLGRLSLREFWARHLRWGRIRKSQAPWLFSMEPFLGSILSGVFGALAASELLGVSFMAFFSFHLSLWCFADFILYSYLNREVEWRWFGVWLLREILSLPLWIAIRSNNKITWKGQKYQLLPGGLLEAHEKP